MKKHKNLLDEKQQERLYLVHHMHHLKTLFGVKHELHHCFLYSKPDMKGERLEIRHLIDKDGNLFHILNKDFFGVLYDHADNGFEVKNKEIGSKNYCYIE